MKKASLVLSGMFAAVCVALLLPPAEGGKKYGFEIKSCVTGAALPETAGEGEPDMDDIAIQTVYRLARRSVVKITVKDSAGSGIIWKADDGIVIASNRHLLMKDVKAEVFFSGGGEITADVEGYSQQYDIGFLKIPEEAVPDSVLRDIYEAVPFLYGTETEDERTGFAREYSGKSVMQIGASADKKTANFSTGTIRTLSFVPLFNTFVLETDCYSKAGMSGGGVFDSAGRLLGMISGGDVPESAQIREAELTYSIPPVLIEAEYNALNE